MVSAWSAVAVCRRLPMMPGKKYWYWCFCVCVELCLALGICDDRCS